MSMHSVSRTRRDFVSDVGRLASAATLTACATAGAPAPNANRAAAAGTPGVSGASGASGEWDLSWIQRIEAVNDRAVFDWPTLGDPADPTVVQFAARYLDNCDAVFGARAHGALVVLNIRTQAVPAAFSDGLWERFSLGTEYSVKDPATQQPATLNPFLRRAPSPAPGIVMPMLPELLDRGAIILLCDFALGHLARRLAPKVGRDAAAVHRELRAGFIPGAVAVPSGIFGLARAQNSGCALIRL